MPLLNVNNRSLTSTSECNTRSPMHAYYYNLIEAGRPSLLLFDFILLCRFVGRINIYTDKEEPVAR